MGAGSLNLVQVVLDAFDIVDVIGCQRREADDGVHGRTDVMAHVGEEQTLCLVCAIGAL